MHHQALSRLIPTILLALSAFAAQLRGQPFLSDGLVAYYPLDGDAIDASGHRNHGVLHNVLPTWDRSGRPSAAMSFHAPSLSSVDLGAPVSLQFAGDFTISAWVTFSGGIIDPRIVSYGADCGYEILISNARVFAANLACNRGKHSTGQSSNAWHFVALRRSGNTAQFYINGSFPEEYNIAVPNAPTYSGNAFLGRKSILDPGDMRTYWEGAMDEVRFYNRALSNSELNQLYAYEPSCLPRRAIATPVVVNYFVVGATITDGGCGYTEPPAITIQGGGGTGATATATVANGAVTGIKFSNPGRDYTSDPTITIAPPPIPPIPPRQAKALSQVVNGFVVGLTVIDGGSGYDTPPTVILTGGGGNGATAVATLTDGVVTGFTITSNGSNYVTAPLVKIASPPFSPKLSVEVSRVRVTLQVILGRKYLLESSTDLITWNATGDPFVAQDEESVQEFEVDTTGRYFRISQVP